MRCPECGGQKTTVRKVASARADEPMLTYILIGINVLIALGVFASPTEVFEYCGGTDATKELVAQGAVCRSEVGDGELWRLITSGFLHDPGSPLHIAFNALALWVLGGMLEPVVGRLRFAIIYFVSLLAGSLGALLLDSASIGASGAVFGLMGAALIVLRRRGINPMESGLGLWLGLNLFITFAIPGISIGGHLGGLAGGAAAGLILFELRDRVRVPRWAPTALAAGLGVLVVIGSVVVSG
jgi:membrane associated rhomboid family serine protease